MKFISSSLLALAIATSTSAFAPLPASKVSSLMLSSYLEQSSMFSSSFGADQPGGPAASSGGGPYGTGIAGQGDPIRQDMFPENMPLHIIQGGDTLRTWKMPPGVERAQYYITTDGRPIKCSVELWLGPIRRTHYMNIDSMDGRKTPFQALLKFKKTDSAGPQLLTIRNTGGFSFPIKVGVMPVMSDEQNDAFNGKTEELWKNGSPALVQGGDVAGGGGAIRTFEVDDNVESIQVIVWGKVSKKSFKCLIEVLQGPNNDKQVYDLQCGGGSQPYTAIIQTPGKGVTLRIRNKKFVEDGLFEFAVVPYKVGSGAPGAGSWGRPSGNFNAVNNVNGNFPMGSFGGFEKQWWE